ncbi:MAG TPA: Uma2 family endonuclease [Longimicrobium sp.]|jgi:Uma2 family endonuclease
MLDAATRRWAYEELPEFPEDDGYRYEYIAGELVVTRFSSPRHQKVLMRLAVLLHGFAEGNRLGLVYMGPIDILFAIGDFIAPDLVFVRRGRLEIIGERAIEDAPDLVVEVVHQVTELRDRGIKRERYALYDVPEYWIVDPWRGQIDLYRLVEDAEVPTTLTTGTFDWQPVPDGPALTINLEELFKNPD